MLQTVQYFLTSRSRKLGQEFIAYLPPALQQVIYTLPLTIDVANKHPFLSLDEDIYGYLSGHEAADGTMTYHIYVKKLKDEDYMKELFFHEVGHLVDILAANLPDEEFFSDSLSFHVALPQVKKILFELVDPNDLEYFIQDYNEMFAQCFAFYLMHPALFEDKPMLKNALEKAMSYVTR